MRIARKVYMSIFTTLFILITCAATTFAWVGMLTTATLGSFDLNLKVVDAGDYDYFLQISSNGNNFSDTIDMIDVKRQILENMGYDTTDVLNSGLEQLFASKSYMVPVTTDANLTKFYSRENLPSRKPYLKENNKFYKFDLYLSVDTKEGIAGLSQDKREELDINANVFFENIEEALIGTINKGALINNHDFSTIPSNSEYVYLKNLNSRNLTIDTKNATRVAFQTFAPININSSYNGTETPVQTIIYQGGKQYPNTEKGIVDLGGIIPEQYNVALREINELYETNVQLDNLFVDSNNDDEISNNEKVGYLGAYNRYLNNLDLEMKEYNYLNASNVDSTNYSSYYIYDGLNYIQPTSYNPLDTYYSREMNNRIWKSPTTISGTNYLGIQNGIQTKMKITVYFWYEGYDADCLQLIDYYQTALRIVFASDKNIV